MNNTSGAGPYLIRVVDCGNHGGGGGGGGRRGGGGHGGHRGGYRFYRVYRPCGACHGRGQQHRHDCPRNNQRAGLQINGGQNVSQWLNNVHTPGQVVCPCHSFGHCHHGHFHRGNQMLHAPRYNNALAIMQYQLQLQSQHLMQQQVYLQMQLQQNQFMQQRVSELQQGQAHPMLQLQNAANQQGQQDQEEDEVDID